MSIAVITFFRPTPSPDRPVGSHRACRYPIKIMYFGSLLLLGVQK